MKKQNKLTGFALVMCMLFAAPGLYAQKNVSSRDQHPKQENLQKDSHNKDAHSQDKVNRKEDKAAKAAVKQKGQSARKHESSPWATPRRADTRYVYFRDYNVYYDCSKKVYLTLSGKHWVASVSIPIAIQKADPSRVMYADVDYRGDDLYNYHRHHA